MSEKQRSFEVPTPSGKVEAVYEESAAVSNANAEKRTKEGLESKTEVMVRGCETDIGLDLEMLEGRAMEAARGGIRRVLAGELPAWSPENRIVVTVTYTR